ncbi:MAG TPA: hypothetical protein EYH31_08260 [Anaerolineae bacterium]|nr:hypothetical protein [Anaerolineae bacterium]
MDLLWPAPAKSTVSGSASIPGGVFFTAAGNTKEFSDTLSNVEWKLAVEMMDMIQPVAAAQPHQFLEWTAPLLPTLCDWQRC